MPPPAEYQVTSLPTAPPPPPYPVPILPTIPPLAPPPSYVAWPSPPPVSYIQQPLWHTPTIPPSPLTNIFAPAPPLLIKDTPNTLNQNPEIKSEFTVYQFKNQGF